MSHLPTCRTRTEWTGNIQVHYSEPDPSCQDQTHHAHYTEENQ